MVIINAPPAVIGNGESIGSNTTLNVFDGGVVGSEFDAGLPAQANTGVIVSIRGGTIYQSFQAHSGSTVSISGGSIGHAFRAGSDSVVSISGGTFGRGFRAEAGTTEFVGGEFQLNGTPFSGASVTLAEGDLFTGTYADGSPFLFSQAALDELNDVTLTASPLPPIDTTPIIIDGTNSTAPAGLRNGQTLTLRDGGELPPDFAAIGATLHIEGGLAGPSLEVAQTAVSISGGTVGDGFQAGSGSTVNISGGVIGEGFKAQSGSTINLSGSTLGPAFEFDSESTLNLIGTDFQRFGSPVDLIPGVPTPLSRSSFLTGHLLDGTAIEEALGRRYSSTLVLTLAPDTGDYNGDGLVDATDFDAWKSTYGASVVPYSGADGNGDGTIDAADYAVWREHLTAGSQSVPEPSALFAVLTVGLATRLARRS